MQKRSWHGWVLTLSQKSAEDAGPPRVLSPYPTRRVYSGGTLSVMQVFFNRAIGHPESMRSAADNYVTAEHKHTIKFHWC